MRKLFVVLFTLCAALGVQAQNAKGQWSVAPTLGLNLSKANDDACKTKVGMVAGLNAEYGLSNQLGLSAGLLYSMEGSKLDEMGGDMKLKMNYLQVPLLANWYVWKGLAVKAGVQPGFLVSSKAKAEMGNLSADVDIKDECNTFNLAIPVGVSYEYKKIVLDARYAIGVTNWAKDSDESIRNSSFQITLAYKFKF